MHAAACVIDPRTDAASRRQISFSYIGAMFSSNLSLKFVSYPTQARRRPWHASAADRRGQALAKCCKLIPVMLMRIIVNKKVYTLRCASRAIADDSTALLT